MHRHSYRILLIMLTCATCLAQVAGAQTPGTANIGAQAPGTASNGAQAAPAGSPLQHDPAQLTLDDALNLALAAPAVLLASQQLDAARNRLEIAASPLSLQLAGGYTRSWTTLQPAAGPEPARPAGDWSAFELRASLNVIPYGPRFDQLRQAEIAWQRTAGSLAAARADALAGSVREYLTALRADEEVQVQQLALAESELRLTGVTAQSAVGAANASQLLDAELARNQAAADLAAARQAHAQALASLSVRLGVTVSGVTDSGLPLFPPDGELLQAAPAGRIPLRDDVRNAQLSLLETSTSVAATLREQLPQGTLSFGYQAASDSSMLQLGASFDTRSFQPGLSLAVDPDSGGPGLQPGMTSSGGSIGIRIEIPLDPSLGSARELAALTLANAEAQLEQAILLAHSDIDNARTNLAAALSALELADQLLQQAENTLAAARQRFTLGVISPVELRAAERRHAESLLRRNRAGDSLLLARLTLARALALDPLEILR
jgi:outer membrane protein TolC